VTTCDVAVEFFRGVPDDVTVGGPSWR
jgi:hypothetical protein